MKHAICLLCCKDIVYIEEFLKQFQDDDNFYFFIHYHNAIDDTINYLKDKYSNIKYIVNKFDTRRFSKGLVKAELDLYEQALKCEEIEYFHLFSECCYLICSTKYFNDFFEKYKGLDFIDYVEFTGVPYNKASQWKSLKRETVEKLIDYKSYTLDKLEKCYPFKTGAYDEYIIPTVLFDKIRPECFMGNLRFIRWGKNNYGHPDTLIKSHILDLSSILTKLIVRKIDILNVDSRYFLMFMKKIFKKYHNSS